MKQTKQQLPFYLSALVAFVVLSGTIYFYAQKQQIVTKQPVLVPTKQVDKSESIGGQPEPKDSLPGSPATTSQSPSPAEPHQKPISASPKQDEITKSITKEYLYRALGTIPNDPYYSSSWAMQNTKAADAWNVTTGGPVTVAVIDTGFALSHEDLATKWYVNSDENGQTQLGDACWTGTPVDKSTNNCDDDANGYVDDWRGWNFYAQTNNPMAGTTQTNGVDAISHGTSVAGLIAADTNNGKGIAAFNWQTSVMPLEALSDNGEGYSSDVISAIYYAVDNGADIINMSLGGPDKDPSLQTALDYAYSRNVVVIAAAGNCGTTGDAGCGGLAAPTMMYPARASHVIAVGATTSTDTRASFSSYGPELDLVAPGAGAIVSPLIDSRTLPYNYTNAYSASLYGTSFASPMVASIASLIKSLRPDTTPEDIIALIDASTTKVAGMSGANYTNEYGHGLVNAGTASAIASSLAATTSTPPELRQTGDSRSEHSYSLTSPLSSGCSAAANTYCAIRAVDTNGNERFLPYKLTSASGSADWQWPGSTLSPLGEWRLESIQGDNLSTTSYLLFAK
jgi:subtilisin family serine protease